jgi:hypothetical protein
MLWNVLTRSPVLRARKILFVFAFGRKTRSEIRTLSALAEGHYIPWVLQNRKSGAETVRMLRTGFTDLFPVEAAKLTALDIGAWRSECLSRHCKAATINRMLTALKAMLNWAVEQGGNNGCGPKDSSRIAALATGLLAE